MPEMTGDELALEITKIRLDIPIILSSGYITSDETEKLKSCGIKEFIKKPFDMKGVTQTIRSVLESKTHLKNTKRILVIDDEESIRESLKEMFEREGYNVIIASDGKEGTELFNKHKVALVITDIVMPEKEGIETIIGLKKVSPDIKIIAISGGGRISAEDYLGTAKSLGVKYTFEKPFKHEKLIAAVHELLDNKRAD